MTHIVRFDSIPSTKETFVHALDVKRGEDNMNLDFENYQTQDKKILIKLTIEREIKILTSEEYAQWCSNASELELSTHKANVYLA